MKSIPICTPGEFLQEEFLKPMRMSVYRLAKRIQVPATRIHAILKGRRSITVDTALRLERFFGLSEGYFVRLQMDYDLRKGRRDLGRQINQEVRQIAETEKHQ
jgi:addiction module HigA family antidote